ncbi:MAG: DNA-binding response regulator, partial [Caulobacterales bacterium RIFCSPHIGHO2_01_FULL_67_30]
MRILVVEDDAEAATAMVRGLSEAGHDVTHAVDGAFGLLESQKGGYDVYVVDRMMPRLDGVGMVETVRKGGDQTPVLFLSALGEVEDRVTGLKAGADDYLVKPYAFAELIARVEALSRRRETGGVQTVLKVGDLEMNLIARTVHRGATEIDLQPREFQLLEFLMRHAGQSVTRTMLLEKVWEY